MGNDICGSPCRGPKSISFSGDVPAATACPVLCWAPGRGPRVSVQAESRAGGEDRQQRGDAEVTPRLNPPGGELELTGRRAHVLVLLGRLGELGGRGTQPGSSGVPLGHQYSTIKGCAQGAGDKAGSEEDRKPQVSLFVPLSFQLPAPTSPGRSPTPPPPPGLRPSKRGPAERPFREQAGPPAQASDEYFMA